jgi:N-acetylmuramoyl-L-alanine amidase
MAANHRRRATAARRRRRRGPHIARAVLLVAGIAIVIALIPAGITAISSSARSGPAAGIPLSPATMTTGACAAFDPTHGDNRKTVFLDAGHGGIDPGGVGTTASGQPVHESDVNLAIELDAMALLRAQGYRVVVSRTLDTTVVRLTPADLSSEGLLSVQGSHDDVVARDVCTNLANADALVGIYMDAGSSTQDAGSVTLYDTARPFAAANLRLATLVQADVMSAMNDQGWQVPNDGTLPDSGFGSSVGDPAAGGLAALAAGYDHLLLIGPPLSGFLATPSLMPGAVVEPLYLTDPFEGSIAATTADQQVIAHGLATAVEQFLAPPPKPAAAAG